MGFDFAKAIKDAEKDENIRSLFLLLLGPSGNGKSYMLGTFGCKTLYLYTQGETHGVTSSQTLGRENVIPVCIDRDGERELSGDEALSRLNAILDDIAGLKAAGFKAIALDGIPELEEIIRQTTKFKVATTAPSGAHNGFAVSPITRTMLRDIIVKLKKVRRELGAHVCVTCTLTVKEYAEDGTIMDAKPQLIGYEVPASLGRQFDDVLIIGRMERAGKIAYRVQLLASATVRALDQLTQSVKKTFDFSPRITGVDILGMKDTIEPDLKTIIALKEKGSAK